MKKPRFRRLVVGCIVSTAIVILGGAAVVQQRTAATWSAMQRTVASLDAEWRARDYQRQPLVGQGHEGAAFAGYEAALALAAKAYTLDADLLGMLPHHDDGKVAGTEALRARWRPAIEALRQAARCLDARPTELPVDPAGSGYVRLLHARWLVNFAVLEARALRLAGQPQQAVDWTLDAAMFGADLARSNLLIQAMIGGAMVAIATHEAWPESALQQLDAPSLQRLAEGLERLDAGLPERLEFDGELRFAARWLALAGETERQYGTATAWRFGFSPRWMLADGFLHYAATVEKLRGEPQLAWPQREAWMELELEALEQIDNPVTQGWAANLASAERSHRGVVARVRQLRMAVDRHRGSNSAPLRDPLGDGPFTIVPDGDGIVVRSAGELGGKPIERRVVR
jgi:hypothetical protein